MFFVGLVIGVLNCWAVILLTNRLVTMLLLMIILCIPLSVNFGFSQELYRPSAVRERREWLGNIERYGLIEAL